MAGRGIFRNDEGCNVPLTGDIVFNAVLFIVLRLDGFDGEGLFVEEKVVAVEAVPGGFFGRVRRGRVGGADESDGGKGTDEKSDKGFF